MNYLEIANGLEFLLVDLPLRERKNLMKVIENDSRFLQEHNIMDYSLLLTVETKKEFHANTSL